MQRYASCIVGIWITMNTAYSKISIMLHYLHKLKYKINTKMFRLEININELMFFVF